MPTKRSPKQLPGIQIRHSRGCPGGGACTAGQKDGCRPAYRAEVWSPRDGAKIRTTLPTLTAAKKWRADAQSQKNHGRLAAETTKTLAEMADEWYEQALAGKVRARGGEPYKPSVLRGYRSMLDRYVLPDLGGVRIRELRRRDLQHLIDRLVGEGLSGSTVRNALIPVQVVCRYAIRRDEILVDPTIELELPAAGGCRDRAASVTEAEVLLAALPDAVRPVYAAGFYAGLRRGELRALRVSDLHLDEGWIAVERGWDDIEGPIAPKSKAGKRRALIPARLRAELVAHLERTGRSGADFVFGSDESTPFVPNTVRRNAERAWGAAAVGAFLRGELPSGVEIDPIALHETRHTHRSWLAAAGVPKERRDWWLGHAGSGVGARYEHELAGQLADDVAKVDAYLAGKPAEVVSLRAAS